MNNFLEKIKNRVKGLHKARMINPYHHWSMLIQAFLILTLCLIIFGFYLLYKIRSDTVFQVTPSSSSTPSLVKEELLDKVTDIFKRKELKSLDIKSEKISFPDPS